MSVQTVEQLLRECESLRGRLEESEETVRALRAGEVDAVLVAGEHEQVYTLETVDGPYRLLTERVPTAAATLTCEGEIIQCNAKFGELLGRPAESLIGAPLAQFVATEHRPLLDVLLQDGHAEPIEGELVLERPDGLRKAIHVGVSELRVGVRGSCIVLTDLTEQRHYDELRATQAALLAASERLDLAQQAGRIGTFEWDIRTGEVSWSETEAALYGLSTSDFGGRLEHWRAAVHPDDRDRAEDDCRRALAERTELRSEFRIVRPDGETRWIAARARVSYSESGEPLRMLGVNIDITEQKAAHAERERLLALEREARERAERALRARDEVLGFVAHDLRNPLLAIEMSTSTIAACRTEQARRECLGMIQRGTSEMRRLIGDLLDAVRMEAGRFGIQPAPTDVPDILHEAARAFEQRAAMKGARIGCEIEPVVPPVAADRDRVLQLLSNLLDNALRYTPAAGRIVLAARSAGRFVEITVSDSGPGVAPGDLPHLFEAFWQGNPKAGRGAGLGLAICKGIAEAHGGAITAESEPGRGTTMRFTLPRAQP